METQGKEKYEQQTTSMFPLRYSLFPNVPPYIRTLLPDQHYDPPLPQELMKMTWAAPSGISPVVEENVKHAGLTLAQVWPCTWNSLHSNCMIRDKLLNRTHRTSALSGRLYQSQRKEKMK